MSVPSMDKERVQEDTVVEKWKERNLMEFSSARQHRSVQPTHCVFLLIPQQNEEGKNDKNENV